MRVPQTEILLDDFGGEGADELEDGGAVVPETGLGIKVRPLNASRRAEDARTESPVMSQYFARGLTEGGASML